MLTFFAYTTSSHMLVTQCMGLTTKAIILSDGPGETTHMENSRVEVGFHFPNQVFVS